jgi:hypothetical protein
MAMNHADDLSKPITPFLESTPLPRTLYDNDTENVDHPSGSDSPPSVTDRARKESDKSGELDTAELPSDFDALPVELISLTDT